jgi:hypothetical protein
MQANDKYQCEWPSSVSTKLLYIAFGHHWRASRKPLRRGWGLFVHWIVVGIALQAGGLAQAEQLIKQRDACRNGRNTSQRSTNGNSKNRRYWRAFAMTVR